MSYIDALYDRDSDKIYVVERNKAGQREYKEFAANHVLYYADPKGKHRSIYGDALSRFSTRKRAEFEKEKRILSDKKLFESDINPIFRCLSENYLGIDAPKLNTCFFDIETDFSKDKGFAPTSDPFNKVTAISLYLDWLDQLITLVIAPRTMNDDDAREVCAQFDNTILFDNEIDMFETFFQLIEDADVMTGWNSEGYDIPYLVNRVTRVMSKDDTRKFCLFGQLPKQRKYERFGKEETTYDLVGRVHMDYLQLYKKYNYENRQSYKLDSIGELEVGENKVQYEGTLDQLYNNDFKKFIEYNRQDTFLLYKIHAKLQFLELANQLAHENTVLFPTVLGSVAMIEQAIYNEAHERGLIVPDKKRKNENEEETPAAGAYVAEPKKGIHEWIGAVDINSLYPSVIRALNMAPETIVGQVRQTLTEDFLRKKGIEKAKSMKRRKNTEDEGVSGSFLWEDKFSCDEFEAIHNKELGTLLTIDYEDGRSVEMSAAEINKLIFDSHKPWVISANGTIFTLEKEGVIPGLLTRWYSERKILQKKAKEATDPETKAYWDKRQLVRKILLNSAYGALLNAHCRFYDKRIGQSVTLSGRQIVRHMMSALNELVTGVYKHDGEAIVYGDSVTGDTLIRTDSGDVTIEDLYNQSLEFKRAGEKEYGVWNEAKVLGFNSLTMEPTVNNINCVMRHKTKKKLYKITTENGKTVTVTEDHSVMVDRDGCLIEVKPLEIQPDDLIITFSATGINV
jgi:DNA polymerase elongation subunit (family B)